MRTPTTGDVLQHIESGALGRYLAAVPAVGAGVLHIIATDAGYVFRLAGDLENEFRHVRLETPPPVEEVPTVQGTAPELNKPVSGSPVGALPAAAPAVDAPERPASPAPPFANPGVEPVGVQSGPQEPAGAPTEAQTAQEPPAPSAGGTIPY